MADKFSIRDSRYGYKEVSPKPSQDELRAYYAEKYFQEEKSTYAHTYSTDEKRFYRNKIEQKFRVVVELRSEQRSRPGRFLDVGAGEGFALAYFRELGWECLGMDFSDHGCRNHNPQVCEHLRTGDIFDNLQGLKGNTPFDLVWLDNVLEHVLDPRQLLDDLRHLTSPSGVLVVEVPNDFSKVQERLLNGGYISRPYWIATPDHLSYFNKDGLTALAVSAGWTVRRLIGDFPIDFNLFNADTNYVEDPTRGKPVHTARVDIENLIHEISPEGANLLYEALARLGLGRQVVAFLQPEANALPDTE